MIDSELSESERATCLRLPFSLTVRRDVEDAGLWVFGLSERRVLDDFDLASASFGDRDASELGDEAGEDDGDEDDRDE